MNTITKYSRAAALAVGLLRLAGPGATLAQSPAMSQPADSTFALEAASGGMAEVKFGQLAQSRGTNPAVTNFGKQMQVDHTNAGNQLKEVAAKENIMLPKALNREGQETYDRLSKLSGADFDKAYAQQMVQDHENDIAAFKKEASTGQNADLKAFAANTLPTLRSHLQAANAMAIAVDAGPSGH